MAGTFSLAAVSPVLASEAEDLFKRMDTNGDGRVTSVEHAQSAETMFKQSDVDRDGKVSAAECESAQAAHDEKIDKKATALHMRQVDTDGDGQISANENNAFAKNAFLRADKNSDGSLSEDEFEAAHKAMKKELKD
jgi:Ca2+-binding EF-hand superfamily protein